MRRANAANESSSGRKVLIISLAFPPIPQVGALRVGKLAQYLPDAGWTPLVLTLPARFYTAIRDPVTGKHLEPLTYYGRPDHMYEVGALNPFRIASNVRASLRSARPANSGKAGDTSISRTHAAPNWRFKLGNMGNQLLIPDEYMHWVLRATSEGRAIIEEERPDVIWAFFPHASNLLAGYRLSRDTGIPLVLDFRDPWTGFVHWSGAPKWRNAIDGALERRILSHAKVITVVNAGVADDIVAKVPDAAPKIRELPQGIDFHEKDLLKGSRREKERDGVLRIGYGGTLSRGLGDPENFLNALGRIAAGNPQVRDKVRVTFVGHSTLDLQSIAQRAGVEDIIETRGHLERYDSMRVLSQCDVLLLINDRPGKVWITGKIWDYLTLNLPVLALVDPESAAARLLTETSTGTVVAPWDEPRIEHEISRLIDEHNRTGSVSFEPDVRALDTYSMRTVANTASEILRTA